MAFEGTDCGTARFRTAGALIRLWGMMALLGLAAAPAWSQDTAAETARLEQLQKQIGDREQRRSQLEEQLAALRQSLQEVQSRPSPEQAELEEARQQLEQARAAQTQTPSETNAARLQNAEFKFALSERRFAKANSEAAALQGDIEETQAQIDSNRDQITRIEQQIAAQRASIARLQQQRQTEARQAQQQRLRQQEEQEQQLERQRAETAAAQAEIRRLRALLESREAEQAQSESVVEPEPEAPAATTASTDGAAVNSILLQDRSAVLATLTAIQESLVDDDPRRAAVNRILHIKHGDESNPLTLKALTADQYRAEARLSEGRSELVMGFHRWQIDLPAAGDYVFLYDTKDSQQPRLRLYDRQLEN